MLKSISSSQAPGFVRGCDMTIVKTIKRFSDGVKRFSRAAYSKGSVSDYQSTMCRYLVPKQLISISRFALWTDTTLVEPWITAYAR